MKFTKHSLGAFICLLLSTSLFAGGAGDRRNHWDFNRKHKIHTGSKRKNVTYFGTNYNTNKRGTRSVGGKGGRPYQDPVITPNIKIKAIWLRAGSKIDAIQIKYDQYSPPASRAYSGKRHGKKGGKFYDIQFTSGECLIGIKIFYGKVINAIQFVTNKRHTRWYGKKKGKKRAFFPRLITIPFHRSPREAGRFYPEITGFWGKSGKYLDSIQIMWRPRLHPKKIESKYDRIVKWERNSF